MCLFGDDKRCTRNMMTLRTRKVMQIFLSFFAPFEIWNVQGEGKDKTTKFAFEEPIAKQSFSSLKLENCSDLAVTLMTSLLIHYHLLSRSIYESIVSLKINWWPRSKHLTCFISIVSYLKAESAWHRLCKNVQVENLYVLSYFLEFFKLFVVSLECLSTKIKVTMVSNADWNSKWTFLFSKYLMKSSNVDYNYKC